MGTVGEERIKREVSVMYNVKSKYKNPDKYVESLKDEIDWRKTMSKNDFDTMQKLAGIRWFICGDEVSDIAAVLDRSVIQKAYIGQPLIMRGEIVRMEKKQNRYIATMSVKEVRLGNE